MRRLSLLLGLLVLVAGCGPHRFFYFPNKILYVDPDKRGIAYESVTFPSKNGKTLFAMLFKSPTTPLGTVIHLHGNFGNVSNHFMESRFLSEKGFDVIVLDYQGFGASEGRSDPRRTVEDATATIDYAEKNMRAESKAIFVFGQSLGGAVGIVVSAQDSRVRAAVIESTFTTYRQIARDVTARSVFLWPMYPIYPLFVTGKYAPINYIGKISPKPLLLIHGTADKTIPFWMGERLFAKAQEPKEFWRVEGAEHLGIRWKNKPEYETKVAEFFKAALQK